MNYPDSVSFLYALGNEMKAAKFGLDRIRTLLDALGCPQNSVRIVHVAGTNGKGSTCAMIEAGLRAAGRRTGLFTSPHLIEPTERIQIDGVPVSSADFARAFDQVHQVSEKLIQREEIDVHPSYFETVTAMAFVLFRANRVEWAVVEVGLGGRLDATNIVCPELCVITPIDYDHEAFLGSTLSSIAQEKAGILKPGIPAIIAKQRPEASAVIVDRAKEIQCPLQQSTDWPVENLTIDARRSQFATRGLAVACPLAGEHQVENALLAAIALHHLEVSTSGIATAKWPGRLEQIARHPDVILDGAHNPAGARALANYIKRFYKDRRIWFVYGAMRDKAIDEIISVLFPLASEIIATAPRFDRALRPEVIQQLHPAAHLSRDVPRALTLFQERAQDKDVAFVTGSLFVVGEARAACRDIFNQCLL